MIRARTLTLPIALTGLAASAWSARPANMTSVAGWGFALIWASAAWCILCVLLARTLPIPAAVGALVTLATCEIFIRFGGLDSDGFIFAVKPLYEIPIGVLGALAATSFVRIGQRGA